jgi:SAM-dependent methyltransferase
MQAGNFHEEVLANRRNWDARAGIHAVSEFYNLQRYIDDRQAISPAVNWDRRALGDVAGMRLLHLQCHIGTDSISWSRLGAHVVGLDFSPKSLQVARQLARRAGAEVEFVQGDVSEADRILGRKFDLVYTSAGVLCWLPDIHQWAGAVANCLQPGGRFYLRDGHPISDTFDYERDDQSLVCIADYFGDGKSERGEIPYTYTGDATTLSDPVTYEWKHGLGETITALIEHGLTIERVEEFDWLDWKAFPWMIEEPQGQWRFPPGHARLPLSFSILASRPG